MALCVLAGCRGPQLPSPPARHVVLVVVDTLRADHLTCYGYDRETSPFLSQLADSGTLFTRATTTSSFTGEAISSLFSGHYPSSTPWGGGWYARPAPDRQTIATAFRDQGYATALFSNSPVLDSPEFYRGFDTTYCGTEFGVSGQGPRLVEKALAWLAEHREENTFTYLHFLDPHSPYAPPPAYVDRFGGERPAQPLALYEDVRTQVPTLLAEGFGPGESRFEDLVRRYDQEIAFIDDTLRNFFGGLGRLKIREDTLAVITSDHGEEFLEHGFVEHAWSLYPEVHRAPLLFWQPGRVPALHTKRNASLVDLMPTLLQLQEVPDVIEGDGESLYVGGKEGEWVVSAASGPRVMELLIQSRCIVRGVITEDSLYLAYWKWLSPEASAAASAVLRPTRAALLRGEQASVDTRGPIVREEYYDLTVDPGALHDVSADDPEAVARWRSYLTDYLDSCPPQLPDSFKASRDKALLNDEELKLLEGVGAAFLESNGREETHEEALKALGYL
jgi:hypothetical protein